MCPLDRKRWTLQRCRTEFRGVPSPPVYRDRRHPTISSFPLGHLHPGTSPTPGVGLRRNFGPGRSTRGSGWGVVRVPYQTTSRVLACVPVLDPVVSSLLAVPLYPVSSCSCTGVPQKSLSSFWDWWGSRRWSRDPPTGTPALRITLFVSYPQVWGGNRLREDLPSDRSAKDGHGGRGRGVGRRRGRGASPVSDVCIGRRSVGTRTCRSGYGGRWGIHKGVSG